jgi:uncharacterized membrane protein
VALINSSSFSCTAVLSLFCAFWIRNTIRNVTILLIVFMTSCQLSENPKIGPVINQAITNAAAKPNTHGRPLLVAVSEANLENQCWFVFPDNFFALG